jgi:hypothetical protein
VLVFCQNFFLQFFEGELSEEITSIDADAKRKAVRIRKKLTKGNTPEEIVLLITWFEKLCDIYPDILAATYGGSYVGFKKFLTDDLPTLLERCVSWARAKEYKSIQKKAAQTEKALANALRST